MKKSRVFLTIILLIIISGTLYIGLPYLLTDFTKFDPGVWDKYWWQRGNMIDDLEANYQLEGMNKDEIEQLLGNKKCGFTDTYKISEIVINPRISYYVGGFISIEYYVISLNEEYICIGTYRYINRD